APPMPPPPPPAAEAPPAPPPPPQMARLETRRRTYLHAHPAGGAVIAVLPPGTPVEPIGGRPPKMGKLRETWEHVHTPRGNGWVLRRDLRPV
ncbi:MAG TPA: hypothetical protein VE993_19960, partial [Stellaceae bacterium]|nr:hypothetical protein [Stellaceae bacterium]